MTLPVLLFVATINYTIDPAHIFHPEYIDEIIEGLQRGKNVTNVTNIDERLFRKTFIELHRGETFDYLVIGSSRIMTISEDAFPGKRLLNIGVSGCTLEEMTALFQICKDNDVRYKNVIIGADPVMFNGCGGIRHEENDIWKYREYKSAIKNILSPSYFQSCLPGLYNNFHDRNDISFTDSYKNEGLTYRTDGSIYYGKAYRNSTTAMADEDARNNLHGNYDSFNSISQENANIFKNLVEYLRSKKTSVIFFLCPLHPIFYERCMNMPGFVQSMKYIKDYAAKDSIPCIGDFNPNTLRLNNTHFYDGPHLKMEIVSSLIEKHYKYK